MYNVIKDSICNFYMYVHTFEATMSTEEYRLQSSDKQQRLILQNLRVTNTSYELPSTPHTSFGISSKQSGSNRDQKNPKTQQHNNIGQYG